MFVSESGLQSDWEKKKWKCWELNFRLIYASFFLGKGDEQTFEKKKQNIACNGWISPMIVHSSFRWLSMILPFHFVVINFFVNLKISKNSWIAYLLEKLKKNKKKTGCQIQHCCSALNITLIWQFEHVYIYINKTSTRFVWFVSPVNIKLQPNVLT